MFIKFLIFVVFVLGATLSNAVHPGLVSSFGVGGLAVAATPGHLVTPGYGSNHIELALPDSAGRIVVLSQITGSMAVARLLADGYPDASFAADQTVVRAAPLEKRGTFNLDAFDRPVFAFYTDNPIETTLVLYRFRLDGAADTSFGQNGRSELRIGARITSYGVYPAQPTSLRARADGGLFVKVGAGAAVAVTPSGALDSTYGSNGVVNLGYTIYGYSGYQNLLLGIDAAGVFYSSTFDGASGRYRVRRTLANGSIDTQYGVDGSLLLPAEMQGEVDAFLSDLGTLTLIGYSPVRTSISLIRITGAGAIDSSFGVVRLAVADAQICDVTSTGDVLMSIGISTQVTTAQTRFSVVKADGTPDRTFGGLGSTRLEATAVQGRIVARSAAFSKDGQSVLLAGLPSGEQPVAVVVAKLNRSFQHVLDISELRPDVSPLKYGSEYSIGVTLVGDQGNPAGRVFFSTSDGDCEANVYHVVGSPDHRYSCFRLLTKAAGKVSATAVYSEDDIYQSQTVIGANYLVAKATLATAFFRGPSSTLPKDKFAVSFRAGPLFQTPNYTALGYVEVTDGERSCRVTAPFDIYRDVSCTLSLTTTGSRTLRILHRGDPNFEEDTGARLVTEVLPPIIALPFTTRFGTEMIASFQSSDLNCGLKSSGLSGAGNLGNQSADFLRARRRSGTLFVRTVDDCTPGFVGTVSVSPRIPTTGANLLYAYSRVSGWSNALAASTIAFSDDGEWDYSAFGLPGQVSVVLTVDAAEERAKCLFDQNSFAATREGLVLLRYAEGWPTAATSQGIGIGAASRDYWLSVASCTTCTAEMDIDGDGAFTLIDAQLILRHKLGLRGISVTSGLDFSATLRDANQVAAYLSNGCQ